MALNPGKPLRRITPLKSSSSLHRGGFLKRGAFVSRSKAIVQKRPVVSPEEKSAKKLVKARAQNRCEGCGTTRGPLDWSHRVARSHGGPWCPSNGVLLCRRQHEWAHSFPIRAREQFGWILESHQDHLAEPAYLLDHGWVLLNDDGTTTRYEKKEVA